MMQRVPAFASLLLFIKQRRAVARGKDKCAKRGGAAAPGVAVVGLAAKVSIKWSCQSCCCCQADKHSGTDVLFILAQH